MTGSMRCSHRSRRITPIPPRDRLQPIHREGPRTMAKTQIVAAPGLPQIVITLVMIVPCRVD